MRIAIMQPYFMPYAGYFRLMAAADVFVIYDCVQFPRRGWVHRNQFTKANGKKEWLTLPLAKSDRNSTRIMDMHFADNAQGDWERRIAEFPLIAGDTTPLMQTVRALNGTPCNYIETGLRDVCDRLGFGCEFTRSSTLGLPESLKSQERILAIAEHFKATHYINAPGGRALYQEEAFTEKGIVLSFLPDYRGNFSSILERLLMESPESVAQEIRRNI